MEVREPEMFLLSKKHRSSEVRERVLGAFAALPLVGYLLCSSALSQSLPELRFCPPTIQHTCFIGYVTAPNRIAVIISSTDNDPLVGKDQEVKGLSLSSDVGSVVMLDATASAGTITEATLVSVADPLLTALYLSSFLSTTQPVPN